MYPHWTAISARLQTETFVLTCTKYMRGSRKFCQRGSNFDNVFRGGGGRGKDPNATLGGPASFKWRFAGVLMLGQQRKLAW